MQFVDSQTNDKVVNFMYGVYGWMSVGLATTAGVAYAISTSPTLMKAIFTNSWITIGLFLFQIGLVVALSGFITKMNPATASLLFLAYAAAMGVTLSSIFLVYSLPSIYATFFVTAGMFGSMALYGYVTKADLTQMGYIAGMAVWGLILALLVNMFWKNSGFELVISAVGVIIFTLLTAYDTQKIKQIAQQMIYSRQDVGGIAIIGALTLYLDFINMFLFLLRILGQREKE
ncbi:Bax inhibitor-1/YccA family protein [Candidatus Dependentiae bacterium]|nr:Bax inhibitor-1/YccA family protein [Candidatus Dependentiae bacterium]MCC7414894.1 Bax inhibitor-1/YccA family protein [Campylobacterota bacterium]